MGPVGAQHATLTEGAAYRARDMTGDQGEGSRVFLKARYARRRDVDLRREMWPVGAAREMQYLLYFLAGLGYLVVPSRAITRGLGEEFAMVWAVFLCVGGALGALALTRIILFEYVALPLLITSMALFGLICIWLAYNSAQSGRTDSVTWVLGLVFLAVAAGLVARMRDLHRQMAVQRAVRALTGAGSGSNE